MRLILGATVGLVLFAVLLRGFLRTPPGKLARRLRMAAGLVLLALGGGLLLARQFALALPVGMAGWIILRRESAVRTSSGAGRTSTVRAPGLEMMLDHESGEMDGRVLTGRHAGTKLSELSLADLMEFAAELRGDASPYGSWKAISTARMPAGVTTSMLSPRTGMARRRVRAPWTRRKPMRFLGWSRAPARRKFGTRTAG
jgi:hypothetical protein